MIERDERHPQPIAHAAIRRLRRNPPKKISVLHGDYRSGNFMHDGRGKILAVLDWEMTHLGDAVEDLAWCFDPLWNHFDDATVAGTIPEAEAIAIWERESGLRVDPDTLAWWKLFSAVKSLRDLDHLGQGIRDRRQQSPARIYRHLQRTPA